MSNFGYYDTHQPGRGTYRPIIEETTRLMTPEEEALVDQLFEEAEQNQDAWDASISAAFEAFLKSSDFRAGLINSTKASWSGWDFRVELFEDGTWRLLSKMRTEWAKNRYVSPGVILKLPVLDDDGLQEAMETGIDEGEYLSLCFDNEEAELTQELRQSLQEALRG